MARVPEIIRQKPLSQVAPDVPAQSGQAFRALASVFDSMEEFFMPAALDQAREEGEKAVYRDNDGKLKVADKSVLGGKFAEVHNSAAYAKYLGQKQIDISETFTELSVKYEFDPSGFKDAADSYVKALEADEDIPGVLKEELLMNVRTEATRRFNGLYSASVSRTRSAANTNTKQARDLLVEDYVSLFVEGDEEGAAAKLAEIEAISEFRSKAPYIGDTPAETEAFMRGVRGSAKAAKLIRDLEELDGAESISDDARAELLETLKDPDIDVAVRQRLYSAAKGVLKSVDAASIANALLDDSFYAKAGRANGQVNLMDFAVGGATRPDSFSGMDDGFEWSLQSMFAQAPEGIKDELKILSGYRSPELQAKLWADALEKYGSADEARKWVAPPGNSQHNHGFAADLQYLSPEAREWVHANAEKFGLHFPLSNEPWHIELIGARQGEFAGLRDFNQERLADAGIPATEANELLAFNFGFDQTVEIYQSDPDRLVSEILSESTVKAYPVLEGMTVRQLRSWAERAMTMKASDLSALAVPAYQIEDPELRSLVLGRVKDAVTARAAVESAARATYDERILNGDKTLTSQEILEDHSLSNADQKVLLSNLASARKAVESQARTITNLNDENFSWNPYDSGQRKDVNELFVENVGDVDLLASEDAMLLAGQLTERTGFLPEKMFDTLRAAMSTKDPERLATALEFANRVVSDAPNALEPYGGRKVIEDALAAYRVLASSATAVEAAQGIIDMRETPKNLTDEARKVSKDLSISEVEEYFDKSFFSTPDMGSSIEQEAIMGEYRTQFELAYAGSRDLAVAQSVALDRLGRTYGVNTVSGTGRVMKYPPNKSAHYMPIGGSQDWMKEQLEAEVSAMAFGDDAFRPGTVSEALANGMAAGGLAKWVTADQIKLVSDDTTAAEWKSNKPPSYKVYYMVDGKLELAPGRFRFDPAEYRSAAQADFEETRIKRLEIDDAARAWGDYQRQQLEGEGN